MKLKTKLLIAALPMLTLVGCVGGTNAGASVEDFQPRIQTRIMRENSEDVGSLEEGTTEVFESIPVCKDFNLVEGGGNLINNLIFNYEDKYYVIEYINFAPAGTIDENSPIIAYKIVEYQKIEDKKYEKIQEKDAYSLFVSEFDFMKLANDNFYKLEQSNSSYGTRRLKIIFAGEKQEEYLEFLLLEESGSWDEEFSIKHMNADTKAPTIEGPSHLIKATGLTLTTKDIKSLYKVVDDRDENLEVKIKTDSFTGYGDKAGTYEIALTAVDKAGNKSTKVLDIKVMNNIPNVFYTDRENIYVNKSVGLMEEDVMELLIANNEVQAGYSSFGIETDDFMFDDMNYNDEGSYKISQVIL